MGKSKLKNLRFKIKNFFRLSVLVSIKESYLTMRNIYGLCFHPFLTTKRIMKERDYSQGILIFGLPIYLWIGWLLVLLVSRFFIFQELRFGFWAQTSFLLITALVFLFLLFLGYWIYKARRE